MTHPPTDRPPASPAEGVALHLVAIGALFTPLPWNSLVMGVLGGGALLCVGLVRRGPR